MADLYESAKSALRALRANIFRSVLTLLGAVDEATLVDL